MASTARLMPLTSTNRVHCRYGVKIPDTARTGAHPRAPRERTTEHPSADSSTYDQSLPRDEQEDEAAGASSSTGPGERSRAFAPRHRRQFTDTAAGEPKWPDWTRFVVQASLKRLRSYDPKVITTELRKLHLRWWHASEYTMRKILSAAGLDEARLSLIKPIVDSCRECRCWARPDNKNIPSVSLPTKFCEEGECDILFYGEDKKIFHIIDRAIRLADGQLITHKTTETLLSAYVDC